MRVFLAILGAAIGLGLGLYYTWKVNPVEYTNTVPASLSADDKAEYMKLTALAYRADGDIERARTRLAALGETNPEQAVTALAQRMAASGGNSPTVSALAALAVALGVGPATPTHTGAQLNASPSEPTDTLEPSPTPLPTATPQLLPTRAPSPTPPGAFEFVGKQTVCDARLSPPLLQVVTQDAQGNPVPGVEVMVEWSTGFDHFFTGLKPELGAGYGDLAIQAGADYTVRLASDPAGEITALRSEPCTDEAGRSFPGSIQLIFRQP